MTLTKRLLLMSFAVLLGLLSACGDGDDRLDSLEPKFTEITRGMTMDDVNALVGEPASTEPLPDSNGQMMSVWPDETRVIYDSNKAVISVIHNGVSLDLP